MNTEHRPRRSQIFSGTPRLRRQLRTNARAGRVTEPQPLVVRRGVVTRADVSDVHDGRRALYADQIREQPARDKLELRDATDAYDTAAAALTTTTSRLSGARGGNRRSYRDANREYRKARRALIVAEADVTRLNDVVTKPAPSVPQPRPAAQPYTPTSVAPATNVAYPAIRVSERRRQKIGAEVGRREHQAAEANARDMAEWQANDVASRGVRAAEARSAARAAAMDAASAG